ncbi:LacI family DNA-binding transcriptional regulator [Shinella daejeonensis]|uniref:LacI family DNA-binding transcriptional regulator n=1 Tax=Shinella daejeonensis TaxID=659017 RepID=UPI0020C7605F|nr:LacI family DNA-binding transcriptional regulator [Shinella daejeonensis]MCP8896557.1 LacI family DNA-binding transcriptional regulator [Shinella daejeonensis]
MRRVSIAEIMRESGLSRATVDRVLNGRGRVHPRTRAVVEETLRRLAASATRQDEVRAGVDIVMRLGKGMTAQLAQGWELAGAPGDFHDMYQAREDDMLPVLEEVCARVDRPIIVASKNTERIAALLRDARAKGKRVVSFVSDLDIEARDVFVGIDNRAAGQTAAFLIGRALGDRPTLVGVALGDVAFRCHEDREIGFRTALRAHFPKLVIAGEALGEDSPAMTHEAVRRLIQDQPALGAIYNVGAGNQGLVEALKEAGRAADLFLVGHEVNSTIAPLLREGSLDFAITQNPFALLSEALRQAVAEPEAPARDSILLDFAVYTRFNIPNFGQPGAAG